ncbi:adenylate/guanylate cyclase domain-containing protein [Gordonia phosphorivorans]|uniref:Adenylate/guanylate cyclase domain-containing protein n=1 Tax=Gordonia phosphorivorans TaxID=1056982 RepID=A0ABV6H6T2_9ACTN
MPIQRSRKALHAFADRLDTLGPRHWVTSILSEVGSPVEREQWLAADWQALDSDVRRRLVDRAAVVAFLFGVFSKLIIGLETFALVLLAFNGGRITLDSGASHPDFFDMLIAAVVGTAASTVAAVLMVRPHFTWFIAGAPADPAQRRAVARIPIRQVGADLIGWAVSFGTYAFIADVSDFFLAIVGGAFALAAITSCSLTYLIAETATRPLAILALRGTSEARVVHGVRERMVVVWGVSAAVPMIGLITINAGRWAGWLPPAAGPLDWTSVALALVALSSGLSIVMLVGRAIADPLTEMRKVIEAASDGDFGRRVAVYDSSELGILQTGLNDLLDGLAERERIRALFSKHVGDRVAELAISHRGEMVGTNTDVAVIFVDLTGSTAFASQRDPQETAAVLNVFFSVVAEVVAEYDGLINKFEGDAALVVFGAPTALADAAGAALAAARELGDRLGEKVPLEWGMGIGYGTVFAGNIGAANRYEYTVIGDSVNEAARLSDRAKEGRLPIYASGAAVAAADPDEAHHWQPLERVMLRGRKDHTEVFVPTALANRAEPPTLGSVLSEMMKLPSRRGR